MAGNGPSSPIVTASVELNLKQRIARLSEPNRQAMFA
jgi:hypothetical protein